MSVSIPESLLCYYSTASRLWTREGGVPETVNLQERRMETPLGHAMEFFCLFFVFF